MLKKYPGSVLRLRGGASFHVGKKLASQGFRSFGCGRKHLFGLFLHLPVGEGVNFPYISLAERHISTIHITMG
jgi:hypothetical protein